MCVKHHDQLLQGLLSEGGDEAGQYWTLSKISVWSIVVHCRQQGVELARQTSGR
jgi:hypothetical protein